MNAFATLTVCLEVKLNLLKFSAEGEVNVTLKFVSILSPKDFFPSRQVEKLVEDFFTLAR